ncbi:cell division protein FtsB [Porticoccus sp.]|jgi:cell division protein FtsB|uniref:cell division protein FtsB n=1 Tax=Porticoccus sp. TaxID=2024853 RepID=UPI003F69DA84
MRWLLIVLTGLLAVLQYQLWLGEGGFSKKLMLQRQVEQQRQENQGLQLRNSILENEVANLKDGFDSIEERARKDLGMIKEGETFYMVVEKEDR